jgi:8-oxo-dGTP pyrophosphatase MutT (NUDIX family)
MMDEIGLKNVGPYVVLSTEIKYKNPWISVREDTVIRPGGERGIFGVVEMIPGSSVVALTDNNEIYLVSEYKYGIKRESLEVISGAIEAGETPLDAAKRELVEELGIIANQWTDLGMVDPFTTVINSPNYIYLAKGLTLAEANPDAGEIVRLVKVHFDEALRLVLNGEITHSASCVAILRTARVLGE